MVAISPLFVMYDREVRMYPLFVFLSLGSSLCLIKAVKTNKSLNWFGYIICTMLATYTHYYSFLLLGGQWLYILINLRRLDRWIKYFLAQLIFVFLYLPWLPAFINHLQLNFGIGKFVRFPVVGGCFTKVAYLFYAFCLGQTIMPWTFWITIPAGIIYGILFVLGLKELVRSKKQLSYVLSLLCVPIIIASIYSEPMPRYLLFVAPLFFLVLGKGFEAIRPVYIKRFIVGAILAITSYGLFNYYAGREFHIMMHVDPWREVGSYLKQKVQPGDKLFNVGGIPLNYYTSFNLPVIGKHAMDVENIIHKDLLGNKPRRLWLVISDPDYTEIVREAKKEIDQKYKLDYEKKYCRNENYALKKTLFKKSFNEYRIRVLLYSRKY
jgi:uncharacterized membrane protein